LETILKVADIIFLLRDKFYWMSLFVAALRILSKLLMA